MSAWVLYFYTEGLELGGLRKNRHGLDVLKFDQPDSWDDLVTGKKVMFFTLIISASDYFPENPIKQR